MIKEKLTRTSHLTDVVEEVQATFDKQAKKAMLTEYKNEVPTRSLPTIMNEYFPNLDITLRDFLTSQILQKQRDQMAQSLCYDVILINDWLPLLEVRIFSLCCFTSEPEATSGSNGSNAFHWNITVAALQ